MTAPVFVVLDGLATALSGDRIVLDGPEGRHAASVRRLAPGERVDLVDGNGVLARCWVDRVTGSALECLVDRIHVQAPPQPRIVVVQALPKGDRATLAVEALTEVGVDEVVPWQAARCVTRWSGERGERALGRWRATAREAGKQSRRARFPVVAEAATTADVAVRLAAAACALVLHEEATAALSAVAPPPGGDVVLVVGPEGGIAPDELQAFTAAGALPVRIGPTVLRTSTAGAAAAAVLLSRTGRWD